MAKVKAKFFLTKKNANKRKLLIKRVTTLRRTDCIFLTAYLKTRPLNQFTATFKRILYKQSARDEKEQ